MTAICHISKPVLVLGSRLAVWAQNIFFFGDGALQALSLM